MSFMTTEGDRSGVEIPTHVQKAANKVHAMLEKLSKKDTYTLEEIDSAIEDLATAKLHLIDKKLKESDDDWNRAITRANS